MGASTSLACADATALPLDHVGIVVHDLAPVVAQLEEAGFQVSSPVALRDSDGHPAGQHSSHVVFADTYLEISAPVPGSDNHLLPLLASGPGLRIIALRSAGIAEDHRRLTTAGLPDGEPRLASRDIQLTGGKRIARFMWFPLNAVIQPGVLAAVVEHLTPDLVFAPELSIHANGAKRMSYGGAGRLRIAGFDRSIVLRGTGGVVLEGVA